MPINPELADKRIREKIISVHGNRYGLEKAVFTSALEKATFACEKHGEFYMLPRGMIAGGMCPDCQSEENKKSYIKKFIAVASARHNGKYTYGNLNFTETREPVTITCPIHGDQTMFISTHMKGLGCPECSQEQRIVKMSDTTEDFIKKSRAVHGDLYDYSESVYNGTNNPVKVICKDHGAFYPYPTNHYRGGRCPVCVIENMRLSKDEFITRSNAAHDGFYSYDKVVYIGLDTKITITCPLHGDFKQTPLAHLYNKQGCPDCWEDRRGKARKISQDEFILRAKEIHGDRYDYSKVVLGKDLKTHVMIICPTHGEFEQTPGRHLAGDNCSKCAGKYNRSTEEYILDSKTIHGDKFGYDRCVYINNSTPVTIKCDTHGYVTASPRGHLNGSGCPKCNMTIGESKVEKWLIDNKIKYNQEHRLPDNRYRYDFYLPELNILIEYDGVQHFKVIEHWGGQRHLLATQARDVSKTKLAELYNIPLIRIPYTKQSVLEDFLLFKIAKVYKYQINGVFYKDFMGLCRALNLPYATEPSDVKQFLTYKKLN